MSADILVAATCQRQKVCCQCYLRQRCYLCQRCYLLVVAFYSYAWLKDSGDKPRSYKYAKGCVLAEPQKEER